MIRQVNGEELAGVLPHVPANGQVSSQQQNRIHGCLGLLCIAGGVFEAPLRALGHIDQQAKGAFVLCGPGLV